MSANLFEGVRQWEFERAGFKVKLPVFYYDNTSLTAIHTASTHEVRRLLPHPDMHPMELWPGRCLVAFTAFEYRKSDIGPYNEFSIAFPIAFRRPQIPGLSAFLQMAKRRFSAYVWQLPVTTEIARMGGVELYGYPKFLADIAFEKGGEWMTCALSEGGQRILSLKGRVLPTQRGKVSRVVTYSVLDGIPLAANVVIDPIAHAESRNKGASSLELATGHAIPDTLRRIKLSEAPIAYQVTPLAQAILFAGRNLMDR